MLYSNQKCLQQFLNRLVSFASTLLNVISLKYKVSLELEQNAYNKFKNQFSIINIINIFVSDLMSGLIYWISIKRWAKLQDVSLLLCCSGGKTRVKSCFVGFANKYYCVGFALNPISYLNILVHYLPFSDICCETNIVL